MHVELKMLINQPIQIRISFILLNKKKLTSGIKDFVGSLDVESDGKTTLA